MSLKNYKSSDLAIGSFLLVQAKENFGLFPLLIAETQVTTLHDPNVCGNTLWLNHKEETFLISNLNKISRETKSDILSLAISWVKIQFLGELN